LPRANATTPRTAFVVRQCAPPSRVNQSGDSEGPDAAVLVETGRPVGAPPLEDGRSRSNANPSRASANRIVSTTALDEGADGAEVDVVDPVGVADLVEVADRDADGAVDDAPDVEEPFVDACMELDVTAAGGEGMATKRVPPSEVLAISVHERCPQGTVPRSQYSLGEISA
jgi:hypothetical protein